MTQRAEELADKQRVYETELVRSKCDKRAIATWGRGTEQWGRVCVLSEQSELQTVLEELQFESVVKDKCVVLERTLRCCLLRSFVGHSGRLGYDPFRHRLEHHAVSALEKVT